MITSIMNTMFAIIFFVMMTMIISISDAVLIDREIYFTRWRDDPTYPNNLKYCANEDNINLLYERIRIIRDNPLRYPPTDNHVINGTLEMIRKNIEHLNYNRTKFIQLEDSQPWYGLLKRFLWHDVVMTCDYQLLCHNILALDVLGYGNGFIDPFAWNDVSAETRSTKSHASYQIDQFYEQIKSTNTQLERFIRSDGKNSEYSQSMIIQSLDQLIKNTNDVMNAITKSYMYNLERNFKNSIVPRTEYEQYFVLHSKILRWIMDITSDVKEQFINRYTESTTSSTTTTSSSSYSSSFSSSTSSSFSNHNNHNNNNNNHNNGYTHNTRGFLN